MFLGFPLISSRRGVPSGRRHQIAKVVGGSERYWLASYRIGKKRGLPKTGSPRFFSDLLASDTKRHIFGAAHAAWAASYLDSSLALQLLKQIINCCLNFLLIFSLNPGFQRDQTRMRNIEPLVGSTVCAYCISQANYSQPPSNQIGVHDQGPLLACHLKQFVDRP